MTVKEYLANGVVYNDELIGITSSNEQMLIVDIRGWGYLSKIIFKGDSKAAIEFQDKLGQFITDAINEKLEKEQ